MCEAERERELGRQPALPGERGQSNGHVSGELVCVCERGGGGESVCVCGKRWREKEEEEEMQWSAERKSGGLV